MKFMEDYTINCIDNKSFDKPYSDWHTDNYSLLKSDGTEIKDAKAAWAGVGATYAPFTAHLHQPFFLSCHETSYGYEMIGQAWVFANFPGNASAGEQKHKDAQGKEWDMKIPGGFRFEYVKDAGPKGFKLQRSEIMSDSGPAVLTLLKRGLIKPADLGL